MKNRTVWRLAAGLFSVLVLYLAVIFVHGWLSDWQPAEQPTTLAPTQNSTQAVVADSVVQLLIWNVGYGGLGAESDFFYDDSGIWYSGSSMIRSPRPLVEKNLRGAVDFLKNTRADFFLLQEVDLESDRSYRIRQYEEYVKALPGFSATFAENYKCDRVPIPLLEPWQPYGKALSGLGTLNRYQPSESTRYQLPGKYPMPDRMFQLDRCAALHRFPTSRGKDLVVINIHNSAYDPGDKIKAIQLPYLRDLALSEYKKGNYVVLGGDWNQCPPHFRFDSFMPGNTQGYQQGNIPADFFPEDWAYAYDPTTPTNRKARDPYVKGKTFETLIDFFLVSPNVRIKTVKGIPQGFQFSDHQPVWMEVEML
ncbi:MAG: endonuclease/exonuclease/phosphatase family protein [Lewinellaceae bacterium]|nr:endonuclease/exonuclease/phosphatase family protein [Lewinellaceae bacterium]